MTGSQLDNNALAPDRYMERHVTDLKVTVAKFEERIDGIKSTMVTKEEYTKGRLDSG